VNRTDNPSREIILGRIKAALATPAPRHESLHAGTWFAPVHDPLDRFQKECELNRTECIVVQSNDQAVERLAEIIERLPVGELFFQDAPRMRGAAERVAHGRSIRWSSEGGPREETQATITLAESLVAMTGSIFVSSSCGGRGAAVVAPVHIVMANISQLEPDLESAFALLEQRNVAQQNSMLCLITGASRTADIEKILVMGAHGPRRLIVILSLEPE
jgi:L-lactate dehydrogenase complex protein LldG